MFQIRQVWQGNFQRMGEVFENENRFGTGVVELVRQLIGRVQRVNIGHGIARAQNRRHQN